MEDTEPELKPIPGVKVPPELIVVSGSGPRISVEHPILEWLRDLERLPEIIEKLKRLGFDPTKPPKLG